MMGFNGLFMFFNFFGGLFFFFNNLFSNVVDQFLKKDDVLERMNFVSVVVVGVIGSFINFSVVFDLMVIKVDLYFQVKVFGFRFVRNLFFYEMEMRFKGI